MQHVGVSWTLLTPGTSCLVSDIRCLGYCILRLVSYVWRLMQDSWIVLAPTRITHLPMEFYCAIDTVYCAIDTVECLNPSFLLNVPSIPDLFLDVCQFTLQLSWGTVSPTNEGISWWWQPLGLHTTDCLMAKHRIALHSTTWHCKLDMKIYWQKDKQLDTTYTGAPATTALVNTHIWHQKRKTKRERKWDKVYL